MVKKRKRSSRFLKSVGIWFQVSAPPLTTEAPSLIEKGTPA
jgi:hypothetical protein